MMRIGTAKAIPLLLGGMVLMLVLLGLQSWQMNRAGQRHGETSQALRQCEADRESQRQEAIEARDELTELVSRLAIDSQAASEALLASERRSRQRERDDRAEAQARADIYAQVPDCEDWAVIPVCLDIAQRMQSRRAELINRWQGEDDE